MKHETKPKGLLRLLSAFRRSQRGNVTVIFGLLLIPLVGTLALGTEVASWLVLHRVEQNAADSAAIAAAAEGGDGTGNYVTVGTGVAKQYGFTAGTVNGQTTAVSIALDTTDTGCSGSAPCYKATITRTVPIELAAVAGYKGPTGNGHQTVAGYAIAVSKTVLGPFCVVATGSAGITIHGAGNQPSDIECNVFSVGGMKCSGSHGEATRAIAESEGDIKGTCGDAGQFADQPAPTPVDPFSGDESSIPPNTCSSYYPASNGLNKNLVNGGDPSWDGTTHVVCGDQAFSGTVTLNSAAPTTLVIENGNLVLNAGSLLQTTGSGGLTIVFSGTASNQYTGGGSPSNFITGTGGIDIAAATSGSFSGVAIFQDTILPCCTQPNIGASGTATYNISGGIDASRSDFTVNGASGPSTHGLSCLTLIVDNIVLNGNTGFLDFPEGAQAQCPATQQVTAVTGYTGQLVQ